MTSVTAGRTPVILCFDCEPDDRVFPLDDPSPWRGLEMMIDASGRLREDLERATGEPVRFSWFVRMDPQIETAYGTPAWAVDRFQPFLETVREAGDVIGIHPHISRWDESEGVWGHDYGDASWVETCADVAVQTYGDAFGEAPRHHRFADGFMTTQLMNHLRDAGVRFDLTLEPGEDHTDLPRRLYRPDRRDFRRVSEEREGGLWVMPLSSGRHVRPDSPNRAKRLIRRLDERAGLRLLGRNQPHRLLPMWHPWQLPEHFWDSAFEAVGLLDKPYLAFAVRSDTPVRSHLRRLFDDIMGHLLTDPRATTLAFTTPEAAVMSEQSADA